MPQPAERSIARGFRSGGTSQAERQPAALLAPPPLDGRGLPELLAYVARFSELLNFYTYPDQPAEPGQGRWALARHRSLLLLAVVAAQPNDHRAEAFATQLLPLSDPATSPAQRRQARQLLLRQLRAEAEKLSSWYSYHRHSNQQFGFSATLEKLMRELAPRLRQAAQYETLLLAAQEVAEPALLTAEFLAGFGPAPADAADAAAARSYADRFRENSLTVEGITTSLVQLFWQVHKAQSTLAAVAQQELLTDLRHDNHHPEVGLLVAFLELYAHAQRALNDIPHRHLHYYYREVLHMAARPSQPDQAYLTFTLGQGVSTHLLPAGTLISGGKDADGQRIMFATAADAMLGSWRVETVATLFVASLPAPLPPAGAAAAAPAVASCPPAAASPPTGPVVGVYTSGLTDPATSADWPLFGQDPTAGEAGSQLMQAAAMGFAVAAPVLRLREGLRVVTLRLRATPGSFATFRQRLLAAQAQGGRGDDGLLFNAFQVQATGPAGWLALAVLDVALDEAAHTISWQLQLDRTQPAVVGYQPALHRGQLATTQPVLRFVLSPQAPTYGYSYFAALEPVAIRMQARVEHLHPAELSNQLGGLDGRAPFYPFGGQALPGAYLLVGEPELLGKKLTDIKLALTWQSLPTGGFETYYAGYGRPVADADFQVTVSGLTDYQWQPAPARRPAQRLFQTGAPGGPLHQLALLRLPAPGSLTPATGGAAGLVRVELTAPAQGFGTQRYPAALAETVRYNAHHPLHPQALPHPPFVPLLNQLTVSYEAEEILYPSQGPQPGAASQFFHLHPFLEYEPAAAGPIRLLPDLPSQGTLLVGLSADAAGQPVSLLFDLSVPAEADLPVLTPCWEYLHEGEWHAIAQSGPAGAAAPGFANSCQVHATLPAPLGTNRLLPEGRCWLRATVPAQAAAFGRVRAVYAQLVRAVRVGEGHHAPAPYQQPLPAGRLTSLVKKQPGIGGVGQPRPSFGGRVAESPAAYYGRVSEQLRHRQRALTPWDYEHLLLENFPTVYAAKCLMASQLPLPRRPGQVLLVVLPQPDLVPGSRLPVFGAGELAQMQQYLAQLASPAVQLEVRNASYEQVQVRGTVAFRPGAPPSDTRLQHDLTAFLSPWQAAGPQRGGFHHLPTVVSVEAFLNQLPYVAATTGLSVLKTGLLEEKHRFYDSATDAQQPPTDIGPLVPWAVLVPAAPAGRFSVQALPLTMAQPQPTGIGDLRLEVDFVVACDF